MSSQLLPADMARCHGDGEHRCNKCARKLQIERDDVNRWFPWMKPGAIKTVCPYFIGTVTANDALHDNLNNAP